MNPAVTGLLDYVKELENKVTKLSTELEFAKSETKRAKNESAKKECMTAVDRQEIQSLTMENQTLRDMVSSCKTEVRRLDKDKGMGSYKQPEFVFIPVNARGDVWIDRSIPASNNCIFIKYNKCRYEEQTGGCHKKDNCSCRFIHKGMDEEYKQPFYQCPKTNRVYPIRVKNPRVCNNE